MVALSQLSVLAQNVFYFNFYDTKVSYSNIGKIKINESEGRKKLNYTEYRTGKYKTGKYKTGKHKTGK